MLPGSLTSAGNYASPGPYPTGYLNRFQHNARFGKSVPGAGMPGGPMPSGAMFPTFTPNYLERPGDKTSMWPGFHPGKRMSWNNPYLDVPTDKKLIDFNNPYASDPRLGGKPMLFNNPFLDKKMLGGVMPQPVADPRVGAKTMAFDNPYALRAPKTMSYNPGGRKSIYGGGLLG